MELQHFSHSHPLILIEDQQDEYDGEREIEQYLHPRKFYYECVICSGCGDQISRPPSYGCTSCRFFLHKRCADLPMKIKHHLHPEHPLFFQAKPPYDHPLVCHCDLCCKTCNSFIYHCSSCKFDLDIKCAFPPCFSEAKSLGQHQFICLLKPIPLTSSSFTCNFCGTNGDESPLLCILCKLMFHKKCISTAETINIRQHPHLLTYTYFPGEGEFGEPHCGVCQIQFKSGHGGYNCKDCNFFAHVNCTKGYKTIGFEDELRKNESMDSSSSSTAGEVKHFSHCHTLSLIDEVKDNGKCDGCMLPISAPSYGCSPCNFYLHKACAELRRTLRFPGFDILGFPFRLTSSKDADDVFQCALCLQYCNGFVFSSATEVFDTRCAASLASGGIRHESHEHRLFLNKGFDHRSCSSCRNNCGRLSFCCAICDFNLDFKCANLPREAWHKYDKHPLLLNYTDPNTYQFFCDICEKKRDPKMWFYRCEECRFDAHPECALGKNPYVRLGRIDMLDFHPHPLKLVDRTEDYPVPACSTCGKPCNDLALECTYSQCNFIVHQKIKRCKR